MSRMVDRLASALGAPLRAARLMTRGERQLAEVRGLARSAKKATDDLASDTRHIGTRIDGRLDKHAARLAAVQQDVEDLRRNVSDHLRETNLQLGAMMRVLQQLRASTDGHGGDDAGGKRLSGRAIPLTVNAEPPRWAPVIGGEIHPDPSGKEWLSLDRCPFCGHAERTVVVEWNKLIMLAKAPDQQSARYDYSCCHQCGVVYAARRPFGDRFLFLLQHFGEVTGKAAADGVIPNPLLNPYPLSDKDKEQLRRMAAHGVWVSEHLGLKTTEYIEGALKDRFENSVHVDLLGNLVQPRNARVLEIRPRAGTIAESLRRLYNANVSVMPMWESQKFLLKELYGFDAEGLIDYDHFHIPFEGRFDLIVCNHILVHSVRPAEFLREVHAHLNPGGYVYMYNEPRIARCSKPASRSSRTSIRCTCRRSTGRPWCARWLRTASRSPSSRRGIRASSCSLVPLPERSHGRPSPPTSWRSGSRRIVLRAIARFFGYRSMCASVSAMNGLAPSSTVLRAVRSSSTSRGSCASRSNELIHRPRSTSDRPLTRALDCA
jgi:hypothetical protein